MIRWSYVTTRLAIVGALLLLLGNGVDPLLRWSLVSTGESLLGAKVDVEAISTSLGHTEISAKNIAIANTFAPDTNAFSADHIWLDIEGAPLTRKRLIVREGVISGLKINAARDSSGALAPNEVDDDSQFSEAGKQWLEDAAKALGQGMADDLESVRLARELRARWPAEYEELERRVDLWIEQVKALERLPDEFRGDVLAQAEQVRRAAKTLRALKEELALLREDFQRLHQQARLDRNDLAGAAARDVDNIKTRWELAKLEPATLTDYFLGDEVGPQARETMRWVQWVRKQIPASDLPEPQRGRGRNIQFVDYHPQPWLLARSLRADGEISWSGKSIPFAAVANDWTVQPTIHGQPATLRMKTTVPADSWLELTVDRTGLQDVDRLTFVCPQLPTGKQQLGTSEYMAIHIPAGTMNVQAALTIVDDRIAGQINITRDDAPLQLTLGEKLQDSALAERMQQRMCSIDNLSVVVTIEGEITSPKTSIESPLGEQVRVALRGALKEELLARREQLQHKARTEIDQEIQSLQDELASRKAKLMKKFKLADDQQRLIEQIVADSVGVPRGQLGRKLFDALKRR